MEKLLEGLQQDSNAQESEQSHFQYIAAAPRIGKLAKNFKAHYFVILFVVDNVSIPTVVFGVLNHVSCLFVSVVLNKTIICINSVIQLKPLVSTLVA